jgi:hypothetical protein
MDGFAGLCSGNQYNPEVATPDPVDDEPTDMVVNTPVSRGYSPLETRVQPAGERK